MNIGWPEGIVLGLIGMRLFLVACLDGKERSGEWKFAPDLVSQTLFVGLLYWGGFFA